MNYLFKVELKLTFQHQIGIAKSVLSAKLK